MTPFAKRTQEKYPTICSKCGKKFYANFLTTPGIPIYCMECIKVVGINARIEEVESKLLAQEFSLEESDLKIAKQIAAVFNTNVSNKEAVLDGLINKLVEDEDRRKKILEQIIALQASKKRK